MLLLFVQFILLPFFFLQTSLLLSPVHALFSFFSCLLSSTSSHLSFPPSFVRSPPPILSPLLFLFVHLLLLIPFFLPSLPLRFVNFLLFLYFFSSCYSGLLISYFPILPSLFLLWFVNFRLPILPSLLLWFVNFLLPHLSFLSSSLFMFISYPFHTFCQPLFPFLMLIPSPHLLFLTFFFCYLFSSFSFHHYSNPLFHVFTHLSSLSPSLHYVDPSH